MISTTWILATLAVKNATTKDYGVGSEVLINCEDISTVATMDGFNRPLVHLSMKNGKDVVLASEFKIVADQIRKAANL